MPQTTYAPVSGRSTAALILLLRLAVCALMVWYLIRYGVQAILFTLLPPLVVLVVLAVIFKPLQPLVIVLVKGVLGTIFRLVGGLFKILLLRSAPQGGNDPQVPQVRFRVRSVRPARSFDCIMVGEPDGQVVWSDEVQVFGRRNLQGVVRVRKVRNLRVGTTVRPRLPTGARSSQASSVVLGLLVAAGAGYLVWSWLA